MEYTILNNNCQSGILKNCLINCAFTSHDAYGISDSSCLHILQNMININGSKNTVIVHKKRIPRFIFRSLHTKFMLI